MSEHSQLRSASSISNEDLQAYLLEQLPLSDQTAIEQVLRADESLRQRAALIANRRDSSEHSVGAIWRTDRISCPSRSELGAYLLGTLADEHAAYVAFHLRVVACRYCLANLTDLENSTLQATTGTAEAKRRRERYFTSSAGRLNTDAGG